MYSCRHQLKWKTLNKPEHGSSLYYVAKTLHCRPCVRQFVCKALLDYINETVYLNIYIFSHAVLPSIQIKHILNSTIHAAKACPLIHLLHQYSIQFAFQFEFDCTV